MNGPVAGPSWQETVEEVIARQLTTWPGPAAAGVVTVEGRRAWSGRSEQPFAWASVSKLLVAVAVWVAVEEHSAAWDDPAGPPGSTLAHLMAHASGLPFEGSQPLAPPGRRRGYSNVGIELAAAHLEEASGMAFGEYLQGAVLEPLGMGSTALEGSPAHGGSGPLADLLSLAAELASPTLVSPATLAQATTVAWPGLAGVLPGFGRQDPCDWGLGPEIRGNKSPHWTGRANSPNTYGHFGQSGSCLWVDPQAGLALAALGATPFGPWAKTAWPLLSDAVLAQRPAIRPGTEAERRA
jgi:CubicO group peptidase (beta-lactamase class C family)